MKGSLATGALLVAAAAPALLDPALLDPAFLDSGMMAGALRVWAAPILLVVALAAWVVTRPPRREIAVVVAGGLVALGALVLAGWMSTPPDLEDPAWQAATRRGYAATWEALEQQSVAAKDALYRRGLAGAVTGAEERLGAFRGLEREVAGGAQAGRRALMLVDPDGEPVAWAGEGLLHELRPEQIPGSGRTFEVSFGAVTLIAVEPLDETRRPWRVLAARSFSTDTLPFTPDRGAGERRAVSGLRWSLVPDPALVATGATVLGVVGAPALVVEEDTLAPALGGADPAATAPLAVAWAALGLALLTLAAMRGTGLALEVGAPSLGATSLGATSLVPTAVGSGGPTRVALLTLGGAAALGRAAGAAPVALLAGAAGLALAAVGIGIASRARARRPEGQPSGSRRWLGDATASTLITAACGVVAVLALFGIALILIPISWRVAASSGDPSLACLRLALAAAALGLLALASAVRGGAPPEPRASGEPLLWLAAGLLVAGAALSGRPALSLPFLLAAGAAVAVWRSRGQRGGAAITLLILCASVLAAGVWETGSGYLLERQRLTEVEAGGWAEDERQAFRRQVDDFFTTTDLNRFVPRSPQGMEGEDLAFLLWQASPLARSHAFSQLSVAPILESRPSAFSFGVPMDEDGLVSRDPERWQGRLGDSLTPAAVDDLLLQGSAEVGYRGRPWAEVRWSLVLRPGSATGGSPSATHAFGDIPATPAIGQGPPVSLENVEAALLRGLPGGDRAGATATAASTPAPTEALERVGSHALEVLSVVLLAAGLVLLLAIPRAAFRDLLGRTWRSYSRRLLVVYTALLLVPLVLLNVVLVAAVENRLRQEQRATGEAALVTARKIVADYLASVEPGFDLANVLDDELLRWISEVVRHEINLYWGAEVWASSKPELFTARLLPKRIPGESYAAMAFLGDDLAARTNRVGDISYLELYAPLRFGGEDALPSIFFSMPLLAQQEEVARELAALRRQALLVTAVLILLATAVGVRLSRSFSRPLNELVEGTRRIAAGAPSLNLAPSELELAALVEAVDEMAVKLAVGRERLLREKAVVDRMVQHITSGIVSVDPERRVLMRNRVAGELLGVEVGDRLDEIFAGHPRLAPLAAWLATADRDIAQRTVRLPPAPQDGVSKAGASTGGAVRDAAVQAETQGVAGLTEDGGGEREWTLVWVPVPGDGEPAALLVVEDVTETLRSQRLEAWAEMARIIAHEIKNPLTPIRLNIEHVQQVWNDQQDRRGKGGVLDERFAGVLERCTANVLTQVEELRQIASEFSTYSHIPKIDPRPGDLVAAMRELAEPYMTAPPQEVEVEFETRLGEAVREIPARFDRRLLTRAVRNLVENALRASAAGGRVVLRVEGPDGERTGGAEGGTVAANTTRQARIAVLDSGSGIDPLLLQRIFDPYFSTYDTGTGLGLPIARRIAEEHGGSIAARNRPEGGLEVAITLPVESAPIPAAG